MKAIYTLVSVLLLSTSFPAIAQLSIVPGTYDPIALIENNFVTSGITVTNISYSGNVNAIGSFFSTGTNIGIPCGIVLTTGTVLNNENGPHGPNNQSGSGTDNNAAGSADLSSVIGGTATHNAATISFDYVPTSDFIKFNYVFGSEEYPEYVGSTFNDVFACYISGPGIVGGKQNMAKLPNGLPMNISNVNSGSNSSYYVSNGDGIMAPFNSSDTYIQYDGYTTVMEAISPVQSGQTYHFEFVIADAGDGIIDSGLFFGVNTFTSVGVEKVNHRYLSVDIFPNPTFGETFLQIEIPSSTKILYTIVNTLGQKIDASDLGVLNEGTHTLNLKTNNFPTGVYLVKINLGNEVITKRLIIK